MATRKIKGRWYPVGKKGKPWKTGFATEAKAKSAQSKANKYWGSKKGTKARSPKKPKKNPSGGGTVSNAKSYAKNAMTPSNVAKMYAITGAIIDRAGRYAESGDVKQMTVGIPADFTGWDANTGEFSPDRLVRAYGGSVHDALWRKTAKGLGFRPYPTAKPKNFSQALDYVTMYAASMGHAYANKDNPVEAHRRIYESQYGIDLSSRGWDAWHPASMAESKLPYTIKKLAFKMLREMGYSI